MFSQQNTAKQISLGIEFEDTYSLSGDVINLDSLVAIQVLSDVFLHNVWRLLLFAPLKANLNILEKI
jgi:hypothetical protein